MRINMTNMTHRTYALLVVVVLVGVFFAHFSPLFAQEATSGGTAKSIDISVTYPVIDKDSVTGDILISTPQGLTRTNQNFDQRMFGVLQTNPLIVYRNVDNTGQPVARSGVANVNVTNLTGDIKAGDYITTSEITGKGQKSTGSGYVLGVAIEDLTGEPSLDYQEQRSI